MLNCPSDELQARMIAYRDNAFDVAQLVEDRRERDELAEQKIQLTEELSKVERGRKRERGREGERVREREREGERGIEKIG